MVRPFVGQEVKVEMSTLPYQRAERGTLEEADDHGIRLVLKDRPNHRAFLPWSSILSIEHDSRQG